MHIMFVVSQQSFLIYFLVLFVETERHYIRTLSITLMVCKSMYNARICHNC